MTKGTFSSIDYKEIRREKTGWIDRLSGIHKSSSKSLGYCVTHLGCNKAMVYFETLKQARKFCGLVNKADLNNEFPLSWSKMTINTAIQNYDLYRQLKKKSMEEE